MKNDCCVVVTGATRGLGLGLARAFFEQGARVVAGARSASPELYALGERSKGRVRVVRLDVTRDEDVATFARALGGSPVDVLVNNAGAGVRDGSLEGFRTDEATRLFDTNALGPLRVTRALVANLADGDPRVVVNVSSKMGSIADNQSGGSYPYRMSKAALNMATKSLALDLRARRITCFAAHPGWVRTEMGGSSAPTSIDESVAGLLTLLDGDVEGRSGRFFDTRGAELPW